MKTPFLVSQQIFFFLSIILKKQMSLYAFKKSLWVTTKLSDFVTLVITKHAVNECVLLLQ